METALSLLSGVYFAVAVYLILSDRAVRALVGLAIVAQAAAIVTLTAGRLVPDAPPILPSGQGAASIMANPLAHAVAVVALALSLAAFVTLIALALRAAPAARARPQASQAANDDASSSGGA